MTAEESKAWMGPRWLLHASYDPAATPWHSQRHTVNVALTFLRVRHRMGKPPSFSMLVEQTKQRLRAQRVELRRVA